MCADAVEVEGIRSHGIGVTGSGGHLMWVLGIELRSSERAARPFNNRTMFPAPHLFYVCESLCMYATGMWYPQGPRKGTKSGAGVTGSC